MTYYELNITRIPVGRVPDAHGDSCFPQATTEEKASLLKLNQSPWLSITDNGINGDGLYIALHRIDGPISARFHVPGESLGILIEALTTVQRLRNVQNSQEDT